MTEELEEAELDGDRRTFGPSSPNKEILESLVEKGYFKTSLGAFQAAAMLAVRLGLDPEDAPSSAGTVWNRGSVNGQVLDFLSWYLPTNTPVRVLEQFGNLGVAHIAERVGAEGYPLSEILELEEIELE